MGYTAFVDVTGVNSRLVPAVSSLGVIALYATGSEGIEATGAEVARFKNAGVGVILIDQSPSLSVFAAGLADVADIESGAGTVEAAVEAALNRQAHGWQSTFYVSYNSLDGLVAKLAAADQGLLRFGVADYSWNQNQCEELLAQNPAWAYCQFGTPETNPRTWIPGTQVTLERGQCDIDVGRSSWVDQFRLPAGKSAWAVPGGMSQTVYPAGEAVVNFAWDRVAPSASYHFQVITQAGLSVADKDTTENHVRGLRLPAGAYEWHVAVHAGAGHPASPWSPWALFTVD